MHVPRCCQLRYGALDECGIPSRPSLPPCCLSPCSGSVALWTGLSRRNEMTAFLVLPLSTSHGGDYHNTRSRLGILFTRPFKVGIIPIQIVTSRTKEGVASFLEVCECA